MWEIIQLNKRPFDTSSIAYNFGINYPQLNKYKEITYNGSGSENVNSESWKENRMSFSLCIVME
jgi:hypothetical protein